MYKYSGTLSIKILWRLIMYLGFNSENGGEKFSSNVSGLNAVAGSLRPLRLARVIRRWLALPEKGAEAMDGVGNYVCSARCMGRISWNVKDNSGNKTVRRIRTEGQR
jgi:hypothetical protein